MPRARYVQLPIETDPEELVQDAFDYLQNNIDGWEPSDANLDVWMANALAHMVAEARDVASDMPLAAFRYFGSTVMGIPPVDASPAIGLSTWTMIDDAGYTIDAGTLVGINAAGDVIVPFRVQDQVTVLPGATATGVGEVILIADIDGAIGSDLDNDVDTGAIQLIDSLAFIADDGVVLIAPTSGGADAEEDEDYIDRLTSELQLAAPRPILPGDFEVFALRLLPAGYRATAIDLYNADTNTHNVERCVTVALMTDAGTATSAPQKAAVDADLQARREVNFLVFEIDPTSNQIKVSTTVVKYDQFDAQDVDDRVTAAITNYLTATSWGRGPDVDRDIWVNEKKVEYLELATLINNVEGVRSITSLQLALQANALGSVDVTMVGEAPVPTPGTITVTVT